MNIKDRLNFSVCLIFMQFFNTKQRIYKQKYKNTNKEIQK